MAEKKNIRYWSKPLWILVAALLLVACARPQEKAALPTQPAMQAPEPPRMLSEFKARIPVVVTPAQRAAQMGSLAEWMEQLAIELEQETRSYNRDLARLIADPASVREEFQTLRAGYENERRALWRDLVDNLFTLKAMADREQWRTLTERDDQAPFFTPEDPRSLRETISALETRIGTALSDPAARSHALAVLERAERESATLDRQAELAASQLSRLFASYDARPDSFRVGLERFDSAQDAIFQKLLAIIFDLRNALTVQQWQRLFS